MDGNSVQLTLSISAMFQGVMALAIAAVGFFIKREIETLKENRKIQLETTKALYDAIDELKMQRIECNKEFATKASVTNAYRRIDDHERAIGVIQGSLKNA